MPVVLRELLAAPELAAAAIGAEVSAWQPDTDRPFIVRRPGHLAIAPASLADPLARMHLRHGLELAWLRTLPAMLPPVAGLLAARTAALFQADAAPDGAGMPEPARLEEMWHALAPLQGVPASPLSGPMLAMLRVLWPLAGPVGHLLVAGGDERLAIDPATGLNRYGCAAHPCPDITAFSSCTAAPISDAGYRAAELCRRRMLAAAAAGQDGVAAESTSIASGILDHYDVADLADAVLAPSGTDATLLLMGLLATESPGAMIASILPGPSETGSGVPAAAAGRHFSDSTAAGIAVMRESTVAGFPAGMRLVSIPLRAPDGTVRPAVEVNAAFRAAALAAAAQGRAVVHLIDGSKTGLVAPSLEAATALAAHPGISVVVDACQARLDAGRLRAYLARGWPVLLTGSKFFGGPPFSGAILCPRGRWAHAMPQPAGLADYAGGGNPGLALRWEAARAEMHRFSALPADRAAAHLDHLGKLAERLLTADSRLDLIPARHPADAGRAERRSVFSFRVRDPANAARFLSPAALRAVYRALAAKGYLIGQPVWLGADGGEIGALRVAFGARSVPESDSISDPAAAAVADGLRACVEALGQVLDGLPAG